MQVPNGATSSVSIAFAWGDAGSLDVKVESESQDLAHHALHGSHESNGHAQAEPSPSSAPPQQVTAAS